MKPQAVIFDMDGTLIDSMPLWEDCGRAFLSARGITARDDLGETLKSLSMEQTANYLRDAYGISETTSEIIEMINGMVTDAYQRTIPLKRDIAAFLERLRQADVRMCVATATDRPLVEAALGRLDLLPFLNGFSPVRRWGPARTAPISLSRRAPRLARRAAKPSSLRMLFMRLKQPGAPGSALSQSRSDASAGDEARIAALSEQYIHNYEECEVNSL